APDRQEHTPGWGNRRFVRAHRRYGSVWVCVRPSLADPFSLAPVYAVGGGSTPVHTRLGAVVGGSTPVHASLGADPLGGTPVHAGQSVAATGKAPVHAVRRGSAPVDAGLGADPLGRA